MRKEAKEEKAAAINEDLSLRWNNNVAFRNFTFRQEGRRLLCASSCGLDSPL